MFSSSAYRTAGLFALCLLVGVALSGTWGGAQQQHPFPLYQAIVKGDPEFAPLVDRLNPILGGVRVLEDGTYLSEIKECGSTIAILGILCIRKGGGFELTPIGSLQALETLSMGGKGEFPKGKYFFLVGHAKRLQIQPPEGLEMGWFLVMTTPEKEIVAFLLARWEGPEPDEVLSDDMLLAMTKPPNGIPIVDTAGPGCCDLTVQHLSVSARKFSTPCTAPPCPASWDISVLATVKNIGQKDVKAPFTVQVLLNGRLIHREEVAGLAAGASQPVAAMATVTQPGLYLVTVIVDPEDRINREGNETNNIAEKSIYLQ